MHSHGNLPTRITAMLFVRAIFSILLPLATWLVLGMPSLTPHGTLGAFGVMWFFELNWLWQRVAFRLFRGDRYTYGHVNTIFSTGAALAAIAIGIAVLVVHGFKIDSLRQLGSWTLLGWLGCLVAAWLIPMLTTASVEKLPSAADRRKYEDPT